MVLGHLLWRGKSILDIGHLKLSIIERRTKTIKKLF